MNKTINCHLDMQISDSVLDKQQNIPKEELICHWIEQSLISQCKKNLTMAELSIRIVDEKESAHYNLEYRQKNSPTNVLSFPAEIPDIVNSPLLGDLLICAPIVEQEALQQKKSLESHWAHLVVHGTLHLMTYDHTKTDEAEEMENLEIKILNVLGFNNPYASF